MPARISGTRGIAVKKGQFSGPKARAVQRQRSGSGRSAVKK